MKKIAVILCVLLSLSVFVSCQEPETDPGKQDDAYVSVMFDPTTVELEGQLKWIDFKVLDLPAEKSITPGKDWIEVKGTEPVELCRIKAGALKELSYVMKLYDKDIVLLGSASGRCAIGTEATLDISDTLEFEKDRRIEIRVKDPISPELAGYSLLWNDVDISDDLILISGKGDTLLHSFIYDGTDDFTYTLLPYSKGASLPGDVEGTVHIEKGVDVYYLTPPVIEMQDIVIKVRNSDFAPEATKIRIEVTSDYYKEFEFTGEFDMAEGEFTEISMPEEFYAMFTTGAMFNFTVDGVIPDVTSLGSEFQITMRYEDGNDTYLLEKPKPLTFKVKNADLTEGAAKFYACFTYNDNVYYNMSIAVVPDGDYTEIPNTEHLSDRFRELGSFEVMITSVVDGMVPPERDIFYADLKYSSSTVDYVISDTGYIPPSERGKITVSIKPGTYMEKVSHYDFMLDPGGSNHRYWKVDPAETGNTVLVSNMQIEDGTRYLVRAVFDGNGGPYTLGESTGTIGLPEDGNTIVLEPMVPYGRIRLEFDAPFWHFSNTYQIDGVSRTRRWDKSCPEYVYLAPGEHVLSDISCTGTGTLQSTKNINLDEEPRTFTIISCEEVLEQIVIGEQGDTADLEFHLRGGVDYKVTLRFNPKTEGFDSFYYKVEGREDFTLPNIPASTYEIFIEARTGNATKGKTVDRDDFIHTRMIAFDFEAGKHFIPE